MSNIFWSYHARTVAPVCGLQDDISPELGTKCWLEDLQHIPESGGQSVIVLFEQDHEDVEVTEVRLEPPHHRLHIGLLLSLYEDDRIVISVLCIFLPHIISESRSVNDGEVWIGFVTEEMSLVRTGLFRHGLCSRLHLNSPWCWIL